MIIPRTYQLTPTISRLPARTSHLRARASHLPPAASQLPPRASVLTTRRYQNQNPRPAATKIKTLNPPLPKTRCYQDQNPLKHIPTRLAPCDSPLPALTSPPGRYQYKNGRQSFRLRLVSGESRLQLATHRYHYPILKKNNRSHLGSSNSRLQLAHRRYNYPNPRNINHGGAAENHPALNAISTSAPWPVVEGPSG
jgi:hypothetical protein